jgi:hypothetical protein
MKKKKLSLTQFLKKQNPNLFSWKRSDYLLFFVLVPIVLILIFLLPSTITDGFFWNPQNPTLISAFMSHYSHANLEHLLGNLIVYLLIIFLIFNIEAKKGTFRKMSTFIFLAFPFLLSATALLLSPEGGLGFSGLGAAFLGYLPYSAYNYLKERQKIPLTSSFMMLVLLLNFSLMILTWNKISIDVYVMVFAGILLMLYTCRKGLSSIINLVRKEGKKLNKNRFFYSYPAIIALIVFVFSFSLPYLVPQNTIQDGQNINILVHYLGYCFAIAMVSILEVSKETWTSIMKFLISRHRSKK